MQPGNHRHVEAARPLIEHRLPAGTPGAQGPQRSWLTPEAALVCVQPLRKALDERLVQAGQALIVQPHHVHAVPQQPIPAPWQPRAGWGLGSQASAFAASKQGPVQQLQQAAPKRRC
jgi:hypothetical protein